MPLFRTTSAITTIAFGASLIREVGRNHTPGVTVGIRQIKELEKAIFIVATAVYVLNAGKSNLREVQLLRYLDWAITTPMLLKGLHVLAEEKGFSGSFAPALALNLGMILFGYIYEFGNLNPKYERTIPLALGFSTFAGVLTYVRLWGKHLRDRGCEVDGLLSFFYIGWTLYGINTLNPNEDFRQGLFNVLDLFNKGIYSLVLERVISKELEQPQ